MSGEELGVELHDDGAISVMARGVGRDFGNDFPVLICRSSYRLPVKDSIPSLDLRILIMFSYRAQTAFFEACRSAHET